MKIVSEQWANNDSKTLVVSGYHLNPPKWVARVHVQNRRAQTVEFDSREEMEALLAAVSELLADSRTPETVSATERVILIRPEELKPGDHIVAIARNQFNEMTAFRVRRQSE